MKGSQHDWQSYLPDPTVWSQELTALVVRREQYMYRGHNDICLLLMSVKEGDLISVQSGGVVQARLAVNRITGEVVHPPLGLRIDQWEAEVMGEGERYWERMEQLRTAPIHSEEWEQLGSWRGRPKEV